MPCLAHVLTVAGGLAEIGGLALVIAEISNVQRREFPQNRSWVRRTLTWMRRLLGQRPEHRVASLKGTASGTGSMSGTVTVEQGVPATLHERLHRLELGLEELRRLGQEDNAALRREIARAREASE